MDFLCSSDKPTIQLREFFNSGGMFSLVLSYDFFFFGQSFSHFGHKRRFLASEALFGQTPPLFGQTPSLFGQILAGNLMFTSQLASPKRAIIFRRNVRGGRSPPPPDPTRHPAPRPGPPPDPARPPTRPAPDPAHHPTPDPARPTRPAPPPPTAPGAQRCPLRCAPLRPRRLLLRDVERLETTEME